MTVNQPPLRETPGIPAEVAVMITMAIWVYCSKGTRRAQMSTSESALHSYCSLKQGWLFRVSAEIIGRHHHKKKLVAPHDTWGALAV